MSDDLTLLLDKHRETAHFRADRTLRDLQDPHQSTKKLVSTFAAGVMLGGFIVAEWFTLHLSRS